MTAKQLAKLAFCIYLGIASYTGFCEFVQGDEFKARVISAVVEGGA